MNHFAKMNKKTTRDNLLAKLLLLSIGLGITLLMGIVVFQRPVQTSAYPLPGASAGSLSYPYPPPQIEPLISSYPPPAVIVGMSTPVSPLTPPVLVSGVAPVIIDFVAEKENLKPDQLIVANERLVTYPNLRRQFYAVKLVGTRADLGFFDVLVDPLSFDVFDDVEAVRAAEDRAQTEQFGKFQPRLYEWLQIAHDSDLATVTIWTATGSGQSLSDFRAKAIEILAKTYPEVDVVMNNGRSPLDVEASALAESIYDDYINLIEAQIALRLQPLVTALIKGGFTTKTVDGLPAVIVSLPKRDILAFAQRDDVGAIYIADNGPLQTFLDTATLTDRVQPVWGRGFFGHNIPVAVLEMGNVDFTSPSTPYCSSSSNNCFLHPGAVLTGYVGITTHTTLVGSIIASNQITYTGVASDVTLISAGIQITGNYPNTLDSLIWSLNQGAYIVNLSAGFCSGSTMTDIDRAFDYYARLRNRLVVVAAGNTTNCQNDTHVSSPAKAWNVIAVGSYSDNSSGSWSNDNMDLWSQWENPSSLNMDHEKPEIVAPGGSISGIHLDGQRTASSGTSFAAPQVSGLAALLLDRNPALIIWPVSTRAILMASATHNLDGPVNIPTGVDWKDGAGGIVADLADQTAITGITSFSNTTSCIGMCWWGLAINNSNFPTSTFLYRNFVAVPGDHIRIAISWWANADCASIGSCAYNRLDTDLDLGIYGPDNALISGTWSASHDNNYELVDFIATKSGEYKIGIYKTRADEFANDLGIALVRLPGTYLPLVLNNYPIPTSTPTPTRTLTPTPTRTRTPTPTICFDGC